MKTKLLLLVSLFLFVFLGSPQAQDRVKEVEVDLDKLASNLVAQCADIQEGEIVMISGSVRDIELLENIVVHVRKKGAFPLLTVNSDRMTRKIYTEVPVKYDSQLSDLNYKLVDMMDTQISISSSETPGLLADISPERFAAMNKANKPISDLYLSKTIKSVNLGNGLYPTKAKAAQFNMTVEQLNEIFWEGIDIDYDVLVKTGGKLKAVIDNGELLEITNKNGTNFTVSIANKRSFISDGIISGEDLKNGTAGTSVYLPAGEVYTTPVKKTASGKIVVDDFFFMGENIKNLELRFEAGKLTSMDAKSGLKKLKAYYNAQEKGIDEFSVIDFGINTNVEAPLGSNLLSYIPAGMITVGIGGNIWAGGDNDISAGLNFFLPGCTVKVDGKTIIDKGKLVL